LNLLTTDAHGVALLLTDGQDSDQVRLVGYDLVEDPEESDAQFPGCDRIGAWRFRWRVSTSG
jgi:hypothetical protein